jgi:hypothetical protein
MKAMSTSPSLSAGLDKATIEAHFRGDYLKFYSRFLCDLKPGKNGQTMVKCCFHEDHSPSLSVNFDTGLFHCFGCVAEGDIFTFYAKLHNIPLPADFSRVIAGIAKDFNIGNGNGGKQTAKPTVTARYPYRDESGNLAYEIERIEPGKDGKKKEFRFKRPDGKGGWIYNKEGVRIIPYHLPEILKADEIIIVEGEKDVDNLVSLGFTATCNPFGAGKWPDDFAQYFKSKTVIIIPDNDEPGRKHAQQVYKNLKKHAWEISLLALPDLPEKGDVSDFIASFKDKNEAANSLVSLIKDAPPFPEEIPEKEASQEKKQDRGFHFRAASDLCSAPTATKWLIKGFLDKDSLADLFGEPGNGKSFTAMDIGLSVSILSSWQGNDIRQNGPVYYIAGEGFSGINKRIKAWALHHSLDLADVPFFVSDRAAQFLDDPVIVSLAVEDLRAIHGDPVLIIVDTLSRNFGSGDENSTKDMARFINIIDQEIRSRYHCTILIVHHTGLNEKDRARGASALRAALDWEYRLSVNNDGTRIFKCTKCKDFEEPPALYFIPKIITIDGWIDPDDGQVMTSCVMVRTGNATEDRKPLPRAQKVAFDALMKSIKEGGQPISASGGAKVVSIKSWRATAIRDGISPGGEESAKFKAFKRAVEGLQAAGYVSTDNDYWWPILDKVDITGHSLDMSSD